MATVFDRIRWNQTRRLQRQYREFYRALSSCIGLEALLHEQGVETFHFHRMIMRAFRIVYRARLLERAIIWAATINFLLVIILGIARTFLADNLLSSFASGIVVGAIFYLVVSVAHIWRRFQPVKAGLGPISLLIPLVTLSAKLDSATGRHLGSTLAVPSLLASLEKCARIVERRSYYPRAGDRRTDQLIRVEARKISACFRAWKLWVLQPGPLTRSDLTYRINLAIIASLGGDWHLFSVLADKDKTDVPTRRSIGSVLAPLTPIVLALGVIFSLRVLGIQVDSILALALLLPALAIAGVIAGPSTVLAGTLDQSASIIGKIGLK